MRVLHIVPAQEQLELTYRVDGKENRNYYSTLGIYRENGKENGNYYSISGIYRDNGKENGNYYHIIVYWGIMIECPLPSL